MAYIVSVHVPARFAQKFTGGNHRDVVVQRKVIASNVQLAIFKARRQVAIEALGDTETARELIREFYHIEAYPA